MKNLLRVILSIMVLSAAGMVHAEEAPVKEDQVQLDAHKDVFEVKEEQDLGQPFPLKEKANKLGELVISPIQVIRSTADTIVEPIGRLDYEDGNDFDRLPNSGPKFRFNF